MKLYRMRKNDVETLGCGCWKVITNDLVTVNDWWKNFGHQMLRLGSDGYDCTYFLERPPILAETLTGLADRLEAIETRLNRLEPE